jgi:hypothetical protein
MADPAVTIDPWAAQIQAATAGLPGANDNVGPTSGPGVMVTGSGTPNVAAVATQTINGAVYQWNPASGNFDLPVQTGKGNASVPALPTVAPAQNPIEVTPTPSQKTAPADPWGALVQSSVAGIPTPAPTPTPAAAPAPAITPTPQHQTIVQPIKDAVQNVVQSLQTVPAEESGPLGTPPLQGPTGSLQHGFTLGLDEILAPLIPAAAESAATGKPFSQVYDAVQQQMREPRAEFEAQHPYAAAALSTAGAIGAPNVFGPLFAGAPASTLAGKTGNLLRNVGAGAFSGGVVGSTMTDGGLQQRLAGAEQGAVTGGVLSAAAPAVLGGAQRVLTALRPSASVDTIAGNVLRERAGLAPGDTVPAPAASPLPGMPIGAGSAFNNPGLAAQERLTNATDDAGALAQITAQNAAIRSAATMRQTSGVQLAQPMPPAEASASVVTALQRAHGVLKSEEERLWTAPALTALQPDVPALISRVQRSVAGLPQRFQTALTKNSDVYGALQDLYNLKPGASLADLNAVRSDILAASRSLPFSERFAKRAADDAARAVLDGIESNPAMRTNAAAQDAYQRARDFTRNMWAALDKPQFQKMLQATEGNRKGLDPGMLAAGMFKFSQGTERTPQGVQNVLDMLDGVRRTWGGLATANAGAAIPNLNPATAFAARAELAQGTRDFIVNSMLDAASSTVRDQSDAQRMLMNRLSDWVDTNRPWMARSGVFNADQIALLDRIRDAAVMAQRVQNLRGGAGSETFERLKGDRYIDVFMGPMLGRLTGAGTGMLAGAVATHLLGENAIGAMIGAELSGAAAGHVAGQSLLQRLYAAPRAALLARIGEAVRDPQIAADLMKKSGAQIGPVTRQWARSLLVTVPVSQAARTLNPEPVQ